MSPSTLPFMSFLWPEMLWLLLALPLLVAGYLWLLARRKSAGQLTFEDLFQLARDFGVSAEAVLWRLAELRRIKPGDVAKLLRDSHLRAIDRHTVGASWLRAPRLPERFVRLCFFGFRRGGMRRSALPALLDCARDDVRGLFLSYGFDDAEDYSTPVVGS